MPSFNNVVIDKTGDNALPSNAWESDISLENSTTYYWKVKARSDKTFGAWSAVSAFTTEPVLPVPASTEITPVDNGPPAQQIQTVSTITVSTVQFRATNPQPVTVNVNIPPWVIYGGIALLAVIVITLTVLVVTTIRRRQ